MTGPTQVLVRMAVRTEAIAHSRRQGYYRTRRRRDQQQQHPMDDDGPSVRNFTLEAFLAHGIRLLEGSDGRPARRIDRVFCVHDAPAGTQFVLIPIPANLALHQQQPGRSGHHHPQVVGLVRLPAANPALPEPHRTLAQLRIANRAGRVADLIANATSRRISWYLPTQPQQQQQQQQQPTLQGHKRAARAA